ncbi:MAG: cold shock and DUF1294 domain-containing protein [Gammaproteobacteria bacterium]|nr:cold shock and DUF1294 domain-containing protein [Gammaproteobacteria bacterium]
MRSKGKITAWNDAKGFGFITPIGSGARVFVHISAFAGRDRRPELGQVVTYSLSRDDRGRPCAVNATRAGDRLPDRHRRSSATPAMVIASLALGVVALAVFTTPMPPLVLGVYLLASLASYVVYALDKSAARNGTWRRKESTLHLLSLAGGWPGALVAQQHLRHKSSKRSFRSVFWVTVILNCTAFVWLMTPAGESLLRAAIAAGA